MDARLLRRLNRADVVSFDVFDTAVLRPLVEPVDLFKLMEPHLGDVLDEARHDFRSLRVRAERDAREAAKKEGRSPEVSLDDIYRAFASAAGVPPDVAEEIARREIEAERAVCRRNPFVHSVYRWCLEQGKRVAFISDVYLSERTVAAILEDCGYGTYDALFVSSVAGRSKWNGDLHAEARSSLAAGRRKWLHIGDNPHSDMVMARKHGARTWHYPRCVEMSARAKASAALWQGADTASIAQSVVHGLVANRLHHRRPARATNGEPSRFWADLGYATAGPLLVGLAEWLVEEAARRDLHTLYFLARDGLIMQRAYHAIAPLTNDVRETHYLHASRRALNFAAIETLNETALEFLAGTADLTAAQYLERIGLDWRDHGEAFRQAGIEDPHRKVAGSPARERLRRLFLALAEPICALAANERRIVIDYLRDVGFDAGRPVGLVDIGWHGSMQRAITDMLRANGIGTPIMGLYFGTFGAEHAPILADEPYPNAAYLFSRGEPKEYVDLVMRSVSVVELPFSAPEGSVIRIDRTDEGEYVAVRHETAADGARNEAVRALQKGAMAFVEDYAEIRRAFPGLRLPKEVAVAPLRRLLTDPTREEATCLGNIPHAEGFGEVDAKLIAPPLSLRALLAGPGRLRRQMRRDYWKIGRSRRAPAWHRAAYWLLTR